MHKLWKTFVRYLPLLLTLTVLLVVFGWQYNAIRELRYANRVYIPMQASYPVVAIGDSLVEGIGAYRLHGFVDILSERTGIPIYNAGIRSEKTEGVLDRLERDVLSKKPAIVILVIGSNDAMRGIPKETVLENIKTIIVSLRTQGIDVIYGMTRTSLWKDSNYDEELARAATDAGAIVIPNILDGILLNAELLSDPIHPNDAGYALVADRFESVFRELLIVRGIIPEIPAVIE
jgi:acyl-CoA thioesterase I